MKNSHAKIFAKSHKFRTKSRLCAITLLLSGWSRVSVSPATSFTPAGPSILHPLLGLVDLVAVRVPKLNQIADLWKLIASA